MSQPNCIAKRDSSVCHRDGFGRFPKEWKSRRGIVMSRTLSYRTLAYYETELNDQPNLCAVMGDQPQETKRKCYMFPENDETVRGCRRYVPAVIPAEACYLGWQESLTLLVDNSLKVQLAASASQPDTHKFSSVSDVNHRGALRFFHTDARLIDCCSK